MLAASPHQLLTAPPPHQRRLSNSRRGCREAGDDELTRIEGCLVIASCLSDLTNIVNEDGKGPLFDRI